LAVALPEAGSEQPLGGGASHLPRTNTLRCGALRLPRVRSPRPPARRDVEAPSTSILAIAAAALIAAIVAGGVLVGGIGHFRSDRADRHEPPVFANSIEAWLRHMTVTRAPPHDALPPIVPENL
jgi:hypothetical protein